ncbi:MAG: restriction endonuclease subunit R [Coleofasciculus sp. B1-GNL1-01]|uniref:type I restriction endonuclease n=1 Tax=Coleofasciculus sp. B1-GNL1-01 TaxID=3068484 RepID=UPI0032FBEE2D
MTQTLPAREITLHELETKFGIQLVEDDQFFREWQDNLPEITDAEKERLDRVKLSYQNLTKYPPLLENTVKMVVLSPLLDLADFYLHPFHIKSETSVAIAAEDEGVIVRGEIDVLALLEQVWLVVIESKKAAFSLDVGKPQLLAYMLSNPDREEPAYGLITNGSSFRFIKLVKGETTRYAVSKLFDIFNPGNELYSVLRVLKRLGQLAMSNQ